jgi:hypothetical protein
MYIYTYIITYIYTSLSCFSRKVWNVYTYINIHICMYNIYMYNIYIFIYIYTYLYMFKEGMDTVGCHILHFLIFFINLLGVVVSCWLAVLFVYIIYTWYIYIHIWPCFIDLHFVINLPLKLTHILIGPRLEEFVGMYKKNPVLSTNVILSGVECFGYWLLGCSIISVYFIIYMLTLLLMPLAGLHFCVGLDFVTPYRCNLF